MSKQIKRIRHSHAHTQQQLLRLCSHSTCISNSPIHHTYASTPPQSERNTGIATLRGEWESRSERGEETKCTYGGAETKHSVQKVLSVCRGRVWIVFFLSFWLSFLCIFLLFLLHLVGNNHRQRQSTVASQREWVGGEVWWHPAQAGHLRVLSITNASAANGQDVVASALRPLYGISSSDDDSCDVAPRLIFLLQIVVVIYDIYVHIDRVVV